MNQFLGEFFLAFAVIIGVAVSLLYAAAGAMHVYRRYERCPRCGRTRSKHRSGYFCGWPLYMGGPQ